jgi:hypothetical protein
MKDSFFDKSGNRYIRWKTICTLLHAKVPMWEQVFLRTIEYAKGPLLMRIR